MKLSDGAEVAGLLEVAGLVVGVASAGLILDRVPIPEPPEGQPSLQGDEVWLELSLLVSDSDEPVKNS